MKKYLKEIIILLIHLAMFYLFPLACGPTDAMGMVLIIFVTSIILPFILTVISDNKIKYIYPIVITLLFIPSVFIYYNESALVHSIWYLVVSGVGLLIGIIANLIIRKVRKQ